MGSGAAGQRGRERAGTHRGASLSRGPAVLLLALLACQPYTTRPAFGPLPTAAEGFVDEDVSRTTTLLAEGLAAESIPVSRVEAKDGYLESPWFNPFTGVVTTARPLGDSVVRVRAWINAYGRERASVRAETAVRPLANPSLPPRELDQQAPPDNPAAVRVARAVATLARRYPVPGATPPAADSVAKAKADSTKKAPTDTVAAPPSQQIVKPHREPPAPTPVPPAPAPTPNP